MTNQSPIITSPYEGRQDLNFGIEPLWSVLGEGMSIVDPDGELQQATVHITHAESVGQFSFDYNLAAAAGITYRIALVDGTLSVYFEGAASADAYQDLLSSLVFLRQEINLESITHAVSVEVVDAQGARDALSYQLVEPVEYPPPVINGAPESNRWSHDLGDGQSIDLFLNLEVISPDVHMARITIRGFRPGADKIEWDNSSANGFEISPEYTNDPEDNGIGRYTLTIREAEGAQKTQEQWSALLRSLRYDADGNGTAGPVDLTRDVSLDIADARGGQNSASQRVTVNVADGANDQKASISSLTELNYPSDNSVMVLDRNMSVTDDGGYISSAVVQLTYPAPYAGDELRFVGTLPEGVTMHLDSTWQKLTFSGQASVEVYQTLLRNIAFVNSSSERTLETRTISFVLHDGMQRSDVHTISLNFNPATSAPRVLDLDTESNVRYIEGDAGALALGDLGLSEDSGVLQSAEIMIHGRVEGDVIALVFDEAFLRERNLGHLRFEYFNGPEGASQGIRIIGEASVDAYTALLRTLRYENTGDDPTADLRGAGERQTAREISVRVNNGNNWSEEARFLVDIESRNDATMISTAHHNATREAVNYARSNLNVDLFPDIQIDDPDSPIHSLTLVVDNLDYATQRLWFSEAQFNALGFKGSLTRLESENAFILSVEPLHDGVSYEALQQALRSVKLLTTGMPRPSQHKVTLQLAEANYSNDAAEMINHTVEYSLAITPYRAASFSDVSHEVRSVNGDAVLLDSDLNLVHDMAADAYAAWVKIENVAAGDLLSVTGDLVGFDLQYVAERGLLWITGQKSFSEYESLLERVAFSSSAGRASDASREVKFSIFDGYDWSGHHTMQVNIDWA